MQDKIESLPPVRTKNMKLTRNDYHKIFDKITMPERRSVVSQIKGWNYVGFENCKGPKGGFLIFTDKCYVYRLHLRFSPDEPISRVTGKKIGTVSSMMQAKSCLSSCMTRGTADSGIFDRKLRTLLETYPNVNVWLTYELLEVASAKDAKKAKERWKKISDTQGYKLY